MSISLSSWFVILFAVLAANLPFFNESILGVIPIHWFRQRVVKPVWLRLIELLVLYFVLGLVAHLLEAQIGNTFQQTWQFYAITGCLFIVLAYPGFVLRYLVKTQPKL
ncbi:MAG: DUF2818 family protein [Herbaspirillum sp.]